MIRPYRDELRRRTVEFISGLADWRLAFSLTFAFDAPPKVAHREVKKYLREIARDHEHRHVQIALACGWQTGGRLHYHLLGAPLEGGDFSTNAHVIEGLWRHGNALVEPVRDREDAVGYLVKHKHWISVVACDKQRPCRRKHGCRFDGRWPSLGEVLTT